jgi:IS4 transposase
MCNYFTVALLAERGIDMVTRQHQRRITDFRRGKRLGRRDQLGQWQRSQRPKWMDADTYGRMPECMTMRQIEVAGRVLVSALTEERSVSAREINALYSRRWQVEVDLRSIKAQMGMDVAR